MSQPTANPVAAPKASSLYDVAPDIDVDSVAYGFMASQAVFAGLEVGIFDAIARVGSATLEELQETCGISEPRLQTLLTSLTAIKSLQRSSANGRSEYRLSPNSERYLVQSSKQYYGDYLRYQMGRLFYHRMGALKDAMKEGDAPNYQLWFEDTETATTYTQAQHNGSVATAKYLAKKLDLSECRTMLDVGGGSGAFAYVFAEKKPELHATVLELPEVCKAGEAIKAEQSPSVRDRVAFQELDVTAPAWPVSDGAYDLVVISYVSGSVPESSILELYRNSFKAMRPGGSLVVHDFMVNDSLDGPPLAALWALQHVTVNAQGLGLCPKEVIRRTNAAGFTGARSMEMINGMTKVVIAQKPGYFRARL